MPEDNGRIEFTMDLIYISRKEGNSTSREMGELIPRN